MDEVKLENIDKECCEKLKKNYIFKFGKLPRDGWHGVIFEGRRRSDLAKVAIKCIPMKSIKRWHHLTDADIMWPLEAYILHVLKPVKGVIDLIDHFPGSCYTYVIIMERPQRSQNLLEYLESQVYFHVSERRARLLFLQVVLAVSDMVENYIVHMNIRAENIVIDTETLDVKLIGFGLSTFIHENISIPIRDVGGLPNPQLVAFNECHAIPGMVWSLGILLYNLVHDHDAFEWTDKSAILFDKPHISSSISPKLKDLIKQCLHKNHAKRISLHGILKHEWMEELRNNQTT